MTMNLKRVDPLKAKAYFEQKVAFTLGPAELKYILEQGGTPALIDVRARKDYEEGHVPGAVNLPEDDWPSLTGLSKDAANVVYCYTIECHLAARAAAYFASQGFSVMEMDGGMQSWRDYGNAVETGPAKKAA
jgi:rhodanese-related sulfurtransferase